MLGALPLPWHLPRLARDERVCATVNLCDEFAGSLYARHYRELKIEQLYLPTIDWESPTIEQLERCACSAAASALLSALFRSMLCCFARNFAQNIAESDCALCEQGR